MPSVSVFIPIYNQAKYLSECIDSVLSQTRKVDQILVVDDYSTDNVSSVIKKYKSKIKYIRFKKHIGNPSITFNRGLLNIKSDYALMVSADDWLAPAIIEKEAEILDKNPSIGMVYAQALTVKDNKQSLIVATPSGNKSYTARRDDFQTLLTKGNFIPYMTALVRTKVYKKLGKFEENLMYLADWEMWIRIAKKYQLAYIASPLAFYRVHGKNLHLTRTGKHYHYEYLKVLKKHLPAKEKSLKNTRNDAYCNYYISLAILAGQEKNFKEIVINFKKILSFKKTAVILPKFWLPVYFFLFY